FSPLNGDWSGALSNLVGGNGWQLDNGSLIKQLFHSGLREQIAAATDPAVRANLEDRIFYINGARALLTTVFVAVSGLVYIAYRKRIREGRTS
ncbi:MAG: sodium:calcium symporter, partial [Ignavibacteria bacterium]|nr:sodium:calcium symporter [Ignavibacteria bacterium]